MNTQKQTYKLIISYDGGRYTGWQVQPKLPSVARVMQDIYRNVFGHSISLLGASRTDAGVHAVGQVARFRSHLKIEPHRLFNAWQNMLPHDIVIRSLHLADDRFHPYYAIEYKTYYYHFFIKRPLPFIARYGWYYWWSLDIGKLQRLLKIFVGTHDFSAFCTDKTVQKNTVCTLHTITLEYIQRYDVYRLTFTGNRFVRHMIRRLVGALLTVASHEHMNEDDLRVMLTLCNPLSHFITAPAQGLLLYKIVYTKK